MSTLLEDAREGLLAPRKTMPPVWFYDREGSALFEQITRTPEYYPTETERDILLKQADAIVSHVASPATLVELGAGSAYKTRTLIDALLSRQEKLGFTAVDVSEEALRLAAETMAREFPRVEFLGVQARNRVGIQKMDWSAAHPYLVLFLGSSLGNLEPQEAVPWLADITSRMRPQDRFLLGLDRHKDARVLEAAYNDEAGVTARFNLNLLARMNRELRADFDLEAFEHHAFYNEEEHRVEMHLRSRRDQSVSIPLVGEVSFREGETIHTENSYKYTDAMVDRLLEGSGLEETARFEDERGWFSLLVLRRPPP